MAVKLTWLGHASFRLEGKATVYIDPWKLGKEPAADLILVSHPHYDHLSADDIKKLSRDDTEIVATQDTFAELCGSGHEIAPGKTLTVKGVEVAGVRAYNPNKQYHPRANGWVGFVVELDGKRIYYAGDTDVIDEMKDVADIDLALVPVGGTYTMTADEAVEAIGMIGPAKALPYHWGDIVGSRADAEAFRTGASCEVVVIEPGESLTL